MAICRQMLAITHPFTKYTKYTGGSRQRKTRKLIWDSLNDYPWIQSQAPWVDLSGFPVLRWLKPRIMTGAFPCGDKLHLVLCFTMSKRWETEIHSVIIEFDLDIWNEVNFYLHPSINNPWTMTPSSGLSSSLSISSSSPNLSSSIAFFTSACCRNRLSGWNSNVRWSIGRLYFLAWFWRVPVRKPVNNTHTSRLVQSSTNQTMEG